MAQLAARAHAKLGLAFGGAHWEAARASWLETVDEDAWAALVRWHQSQQLEVVA